MKTKFIFPLFFIVAIFSFQSCENEPLDPDLILNNNENNNNNSGSGNNNNNGGGESTGDYWPRAIGNMWEFDSSIYGDIAYTMVSTESIDGQTYYKFDQLFGQESWLRKSGDSYFTRTAVTSFPVEGYEVTTTYITLKMLVDSAEVGEEWQNPVDYSVSYVPLVEGLPEIPDINFSATYTFMMMGRDLTRVVNGTEYQNVLQVRLTLTAAGSPTTILDYYYAKDIGLIEFDGDDHTGTLLNYNLN